MRSEVQRDGAGMREECRHSGHHSMKETRGDEREKQGGRKNSTTIKAFLRGTDSKLLLTGHT